MTAATRSRTRMLAGLVLGLVLAGPHVPPAAAAALEGHAWWWRAQTGALVELPPPQSVPENGLSVGRGPDDDVAWAAIRFRLDDGETNPVLELTVANDLGGAEAVIEACPTSARWTDGQAKRWDSRPPADCERPVPGVASDDGQTWTFDLSGLADDGTIDVVVKPGDDSPPFQLDFAEPTADSLRTERASAGPDPVEVPPVAAQQPPTSGTDQGETSVQEPVGRSPAPVPVAPVAPAPVDAPQAEEPVVAPAPDDAAAVTDPPAPVAEPATMEPATADLGRPMGVFILAIGVVLIGVLRRTPVPATPVALGPLGGPASVAGAPNQSTRGIGRFARPREGRPTALR